MSEIKDLLQKVGDLEQQVVTLSETLNTYEGCKKDLEKSITEKKQELEGLVGQVAIKKNELLLIEQDTKKVTETSIQQIKEVQDNLDGKLSEIATKTLVLQDLETALTKKQKDLQVREQKANQMTEDAEVVTSSVLDRESKLKAGEAALIEEQKMINDLHKDATDKLTEANAKLKEASALDIQAKDIKEEANNILNKAKEQEKSINERILLINREEVEIEKKKALAQEIVDQANILLADAVAKEEGFSARESSIVNRIKDLDDREEKIQIRELRVLKIVNEKNIQDEIAKLEK